MTPYYKAYVRNGRLVLDEPTSLAEGELVELVGVEDVRNGGLDEADQAVLDRVRAASVRDGRLVLDALTDFDEGECIELVSVEDVHSGAFDEADQAVLERELEASFTESDAGDLIDLAEVFAGLQARHEERGRRR